MNEERREAWLLRFWPIVSALGIGLFAIGGLYSEIKALKVDVEAQRKLHEQHILDAKAEHERLQQKQDQKWGDIPEIEQRVDDLEEWKAWMDGYEHRK